MSLMYACLNQKVQPPSAPSKAATADDTFTPSRTDSNAVFSQETEFYTALYTWQLRQQGVKHGLLGEKAFSNKHMGGLGNKHMGLSENGVYPDYSHLVGIMIINHWV